MNPVHHNTKKPVQHRPGYSAAHSILSVLLLTLAFAGSGLGQGTVPPPIHGVTIENKYDLRKEPFLSEALESLRRLSSDPTVRVVYTPGDKKGYFPASTYVDAMQQLQQVAFIFGQPVDSYYMRCFTPAEHLARFEDYVTALGPFVDIWEVGNEINGAWLFGSTHGCKPKASVNSTSQADVVAKMSEAYDYLKSQGKSTALTLYYNTPCHQPEANEMFAWAETNIPERMKSGLDYLLVSYYEVDCSGYRPDWQDVFDRLAEMFPNSRLGISEFGRAKSSSVDTTRDLLQRHYSIHPDVPNWAGGGFYWQFAVDMVPYDPNPKSLWSAINTAMEEQE